MQTGATLKDYIESGQIELVYQFYKGGLCSLYEIDTAILETLADNEVIYWDWLNEPFKEYEPIYLGNVMLYSGVEFLQIDKSHMDRLLTMQEDIRINKCITIFNQYLNLDFYVSGDFSRHRERLISEELIGDKQSFALWLFSVLDLEK